MSEMIILIIGFIVIPAVIAFLVCSKFKSDMQTAELMRDAGNYVNSSELNLRHQRDVFTHTTETRQKIEHNN